MASLYYNSYRLGRALGPVILLGVIVLAVVLIVKALKK